MWRYSIKTFVEIPLPYTKAIILKVFLLVMVSFWRISLMENGHVDGGEWLYGNVGFTTNDS